MSERKYTITIEEHISSSFTVFASNLEDAMAIAEEKYHNGEFVIEPTTPTCRLMMVREDNGGLETKWTEF